MSSIESKGIGCGTGPIGSGPVNDTRQTRIIKVPINLIYLGHYLPDEVEKFLKYDSEEEAFGKLYGVIHYMMGINDEIDVVIIKGKNDKGEKYIVTIEFSDEEEKI
ncbi:MAG: hypothetical protein QXT64_07905 [Desulfurococcaceae archaeon]